MPRRPAEDASVIAKSAGARAGRRPKGDGSAAPTPEIREDRRRAATIAKILGAATELLHLRGADKLTVQAICEHTGVSRGTFYRYFESKEAVLRAWLEESRSYTDLIMNRALENSTVEGRLSAYVQAVTELVSRDNFRSLIKVEPALAIRLCEEKYWHNMQRVDRQLSVVYESWEEAVGFPLNHALFTELILRCLLSTTIIPTQLQPAAVVDYITEIVTALRRQTA